MASNQVVKKGFPALAFLLMMSLIACSGCTQLNLGNEHESSPLIVVTGIDTDNDENIDGILVAYASGNQTLVWNDAAKGIMVVATDPDGGSISPNRSPSVMISGDCVLYFPDANGNYTINVFVKGNLTVKTTIYVWVTGFGGGGAIKKFPTVKLADATETLSNNTTNDNVVTLEHRGGDAINWADYTVKVYDDGTSYTITAPTGTFAVTDILIIKENGADNVVASSLIKVQIIEKANNAIVFEHAVVVN